MGTLHLEFGLILQLSQVFYCFVFSGDQLSKCSLETMAANALWKLWHRRWGHPYTQNLKSICSSESINIIFHSTALSSYFDDEPDPNVRVPLVAPPPSPFQIQVVVEQKITRKRNLTRHDIDRENFVAEVWNWKNPEAITSPGCVCFTMDEKRSKAVAEAFVRLSNKGLVYRHKIQSPSWEFSIHPFNGRKLPIVCDEKLVDMNFGTGAVKNVEDEMDKVLPIVKGLRSKRVSGGRICKVSSDSDASPTEWLTEVVEVGDESVIVSL
ncbi:hypothetical protein T459_23174 [Capsicum annuum]|uniref:valine--tRNA ligase n=1 Tax=Capsicum annuum TaxID=4072 RepID=A0A2G2YRM5_CAPAN|nr:hypothetical protein FXO37_05964 [Capsicum annuum]PHT72389.1 hypothetical protein T459_23174 [Capsicum annuum]